MSGPCYLCIIVYEGNIFRFCMPSVCNFINQHSLAVNIYDHIVFFLTVTYHLTTYLLFVSKISTLKEPLLLQCECSCLFL